MPEKKKYRLKLKHFLHIVGEYIIASTKVRNNYGAIQSFKLKQRDKERQLLISQITKWGAIEKSPILLSQYWKNYLF